MDNLHSLRNDFTQHAATADARADSMEGWQRSQNGRLAKIEARLETYMLFLVGILLSCVGSLVLLLYTLTKKG